LTRLQSLMDEQGVSIADKYALESGRVLLSGRQALVRLPIDQRRQDRKRGWNTAGLFLPELLGETAAVESRSGKRSIDPPHRLADPN
jgi:hypothetical protein